MTISTVVVPWEFVSSDLVVSIYFRRELFKNSVGSDDVDDAKSKYGAWWSTSNWLVGEMFVWDSWWDCIAAITAWLIPKSLLAPFLVFSELLAGILISCCCCYYSLIVGYFVFRFEADFLLQLMSLPGLLFVISSRQSLLRIRHRLFSFAATMMALSRKRGLR